MASRHIFFCSTLLGFLIAYTNAQLQNPGGAAAGGGGGGTGRTLASSSIIRNCYQNSTAFSRYRRQPMHIENLITIIKKIEVKNPLWTPRHVARAVVKGFQFDGLKFDPNARQDQAFSQASAESIKTGIIHRNIPAADQTFDEWVLDNDERCALHWMISHSMNASMRDDEAIERYGRSSGFLRAKRSGELNLETDNDPERARRVVRQLDVRQTRSPVETGVVLTRWGSISAGRVMAGIAAGLEPQTEPVVYVPPSSNAVYRSSFPSRAGGSGGRYPTNSGGSGGPYPPTNTGSNPSGGSYPSNPGSNYPSNPGSSYPSNPSGGGAGPNWSSSGSGSGSGAMPNRPGNSGGWSGNLGGSGQANPNSGSSGGAREPFGRKKRQAISISFEPLESLYAATLGGEVGQAAILNARYNNIQTKSPPAGTWNDTVCPREYVLSALPDPNQDISHDHDTWSYMTAAEIRGGVDGAILGSRIFEWDRLNNGIKLSQVLEMYYSESGYASEPIYRACDRSGLINGLMPANKLLEQGKSFAYLFNEAYKEMPINDDTAQAFIDNVNIAYQRLSSYASNLGSIDPQCLRRVPSYGGGTEIPDREKYSIAKSTIYAVLDHGVSTHAELRQQQRFVGQLAYEMEVSVRGSRIGLIDGRGGNMLISPNWTDNAAVLACRLTDQEPYLQTQDLVSTLRTIRSELQRLRELEHRTEYNIGVGNGIVILIFVQTRLDENRRNDVRGLMAEIHDEFAGDVRIMYTSSILNENDFAEFTINEPQYDFIRIRGSQNISDDADEFLTEFLKRSHGRLYYSRCNTNEYSQEEEYKIANDIWLSPGTIQYYEISPRYFYSRRDLRLRFSSDRGQVRICISRDDRFPQQSTNGIECGTTSGTYVSPGSNGVDIEFRYTKPCDKQKASGCAPIYLSVTPTIVNTGGAAGVDCAVYGCETPDQIKLTWSHWNMRCGAFRTTFSSLTAILATILSLFTFFKSI